MTQEVARCRLVLERALQGQNVAIVSSGDAGIYGMAGIMHEVAADTPDVEIDVIPGVTAASAGAALLGGAPHCRHLPHFSQRSLDAVGQNCQPPGLRRCR